MTNYSHPKCYARSTNNCSRVISREHYISEIILKTEYSGNPKITGLPWIPKETFRKMPSQALASNILCEYHNSKLSECDSEMASLIKTIGNYDKDFNSDKPKEELSSFKGLLVEKWMLKTICGLVASNSTTASSTEIEDRFIDILFNGKEWPENFGLYLVLPDGQTQHYPSIEIQPLVGDGKVKAASFFLNNFKFNLLLGKPDNPDVWGIRRINRIIFSNGLVNKVIELDWEDQKYDKYVVFSRVGITDERPPNWEEWMKH